MEYKEPPNIPEEGCWQGIKFFKLEKKEDKKKEARISKGEEDDNQN